MRVSPSLQGWARWPVQASQIARPCVPTAAAHRALCSFRRDEGSRPNGSWTWLRGWQPPLLLALRWASKAPARQPPPRPSGIKAVSLGETVATQAQLHEAARQLPKKVSERQPPPKAVRLDGAVAPVGGAKVKKVVPAKVVPAKAPAGCRLIPIVSKNGTEWHIIAGKAASDNDVLSTREGRPHEVWMHAAGVPGSHVVLREAGKNTGSPLPRDVLEKAAGIAVFYSKSKGSAATVHVTTCGKVSKQAGSPAGQVVLKPGFKVMKATSLDPAQFRK